jgi:hypothetical protein
MGLGEVGMISQEADLSLPHLAGPNSIAPMERQDGNDGRKKHVRHASNLVDSLKEVVCSRKEHKDPSLAI